MKMFIGGAHQGKRMYAESLYPNVQWVDGNYCDEEEIFTCQGIYAFHAYIKRGIENDWNLESLMDRLQEKNPDIFIITDEIGYGIVPIERQQREYREMTGRICTKAAGLSSEVYRIICGIGTRIK